MGLASLLTLAGLAAPTIAEACACSFEGIEAWPEESATDVPRNARIWLGAAYRFGLAEVDLEPAELFELVGPGGEVAIAVTEIDTRTYGGGTGLDGLWVLSPAEPMTPGLHQVLTGPERIVALEFTVGAELDDEAPAVPEVVDEDYSVSREFGSCEESRMVRLELAEPAELVVIEQEGGDVLDTEALAGGLADAAPAPGDEPWVNFGRAPCVNNWLDADLGADTRIRLGAYDVAGNFSGWGPWIDVNIPIGCRCSATSDDPRRPLALLLFAALLLSRRRAS